MGPYYSTDVLYGDFDASRRSSSGTSPTKFPFLFRAAENANYVPPTTSPLTQPLINADNVSSQPTLFRPDPNDPTRAFFDFEVAAPYADATRSPFFRYDMRQRLGNLATTRSNVFAIWVTVGFFEVQVNPTTGQPELTQNEMGVEQGTNQRYRGFFIVDRSKMAAFEPGQNHNVDNCVLTSSIIQREVRTQK
jgi:hypothetical protein